MRVCRSATPARLPRSQRKLYYRGPPILPPLLVPEVYHKSECHGGLRIMEKGASNEAPYFIPQNMWRDWRSTRPLESGRPKPQSPWGVRPQTSGSDAYYTIQKANCQEYRISMFVDNRQ